MPQSQHSGLFVIIHLICSAGAESIRNVLARTIVGGVINASWRLLRLVVQRCAGMPKALAPVFEVSLLDFLKHVESTAFIAVIIETVFHF
jgi:hypothetical protein